jgi:hypothetical protein
MFFVPFVNIKEEDAILPSVVECMQNIQKNSISYVNWPDTYPSAPEVSFKIAHNGDNVFIHFFVSEDEILAKVSEDNGAVWTDSCVEFFISFDDSSYYNAEFSCIGKALLGYKKGQLEAMHAETPVMNQIKRYPSLGYGTFEKKQGGFKWDLLVIIPVSAYWQSGLESFKGIQAKANFYKCGDHLSTPHFLSWNPIKTEKPNFHKPEYFKELIFE